MKEGVENTHKKLRICFWNINGRKHLILSDHTQNWLKNNFDIIFLTETHLVKGERYKLKNFTDFHNPFSDHTDHKPRGGISCFVCSELLPFVSEIKKDAPGHIAITFINGQIIFSSYIAPIDSPYYNPTEFCNVANAFMSSEDNFMVLGGGDLNSRVGDVDTSLTPYSGTYKANCDQIVNGHGTEIMNICRSFSCYVVNNLSLGDKKFDGDFTFSKGGRKAQNDIVLANRLGLAAIKSFTIHKIGWNPSDHTPISIACEITFSREASGLNAAKDILTSSVSSTTTRPKPVRRQNVDWNAYTTFVENDYGHYNNKVNVLSQAETLDNLDVVVSCLSKSLYSSAKTATLRNENVGHEIIIHNPIYKLADVMMSNPSNFTNVEMETIRKEAIDNLVNETTQAERMIWSNLLEERDSKALWSKINWNGSSTNDANADFPDLNDLGKQFEMKSKTEESSTLLSEVKKNLYVPILDDEITVEEIKTAHSVLKEDKSSADGWVKAMVTSVPLCIMYVFQIIYNVILKFHVYPNTWRTTIVNAIFKNKGQRKYAKYYRGISI